MLIDGMENLADDFHNLLMDIGLVGLPNPEITFEFNGSVAQPAEQLSLKQQVEGSNPSRLTMEEYKRILQAYLTWADEVKRKYGWEPGQQFDNHDLSTEDYNENVIWFSRLRMLESAIPATEIMRMEKELG